MIALYRGKSALSRAIEWFTRGAYSHAAWVCRDGTVIEARGSGVRRVASISDQHLDGTPVEIYQVPGCDVDAAEAWLATQIGKKYDYKGLFGFVTRADQDDGQAAWFCSELVFTAAQKGGVELLARVPAWEVSPTVLSYSPLMVGATAGRTGPDPINPMNMVHLGWARA